MTIRKSTSWAIYDSKTWLIFQLLDENSVEYTNLHKKNIVKNLQPRVSHWGSPCLRMPIIGYWLASHQGLLDALPCW